MAVRDHASLGERLRRGFLCLEAAERSDAQLLSWYLERRDHVAFEAILRRHGSMVFGVCRRVLGNQHDAEDAFQAVFLVLVRKARAIIAGDQLGGWLHAVASRTALKARTARIRRLAREHRAMASSFACAPVEPSDLRPVVDLELAALPPTYRQAIVLCDLEGKSRKEAAQQLGWPEGTLSGRLARARRLLASRLGRRGVTLSVGGLALWLSEQAAAAGLPPALCASTAKAAALLAAGKAASITPIAAALTREVLRSMLIEKLKLPLAVLVLVLLGAGLTCYLAQAEEPPRPELPEAKAVAVRPQKPLAPVAGKLYLHRGRQFTIFDLKDKDYADFADLKGPEWLNYQTDSARLSPDGRYLAFGVAETGRPPSKLQIRNLTREEAAPREIVSLPGRELSNWVWSPDGKKLAFAVWGETGKKYQQWIVDVGKKKAAKVKLPPLDVKGSEGFGSLVQAWSKDGLWLVFGRGHLFLVDPETRDARNVIKVAGGIWAGTCRFSPDGSKVLYIGSSKDQESILCVVDLRLGRTKILKTFPEQTRLSACWAPDGRRIAYSFAKTEEDGKRRRLVESGVEVIDADGRGKARPLLDEEERWMTLTDWR
jgi:RNA polymerase sigma factor (sigma-70 family)